MAHPLFAHQQPVYAEVGRYLYSAKLNGALINLKKQPCQYVGVRPSCKLLVC